MLTFWLCINNQNCGENCKSGMSKSSWNRNLKMLSYHELTRIMDL